MVILDFQHFYGFTQDDHQRLMRYVINLFGPKLVPRQSDLDGITLNRLHRLGQQVFMMTILSIILFVTSDPPHA